MTTIISDARLRAFSYNVVQDVRKALGSGDAPWTEDDARKADMIHKVLASLDGAKTTSSGLVSVDKLLDDIATCDMAAVTGAESLDQL